MLALSVVPPEVVGALLDLLPQQLVVVQHLHVGLHLEKEKGGVKNLKKAQKIKGN